MIGNISELVTWTTDTNIHKVPPSDDEPLRASDWLRGPSELASDWSDAPRPQLTRVPRTCPGRLAGRETC